MNEQASREPLGTHEDTQTMQPAAGPSQSPPSESEVLAYRAAGHTERETNLYAITPRWLHSEADACWMCDLNQDRTWVWVPDEQEVWLVCLACQQEGVLGMPDEQAMTLDQAMVLVVDDTRAECGDEITETEAILGTREADLDISTLGSMAHSGSQATALAYLMVTTAQTSAVAAWLRRA